MIQWCVEGWQILLGLGGPRLKAAIEGSCLTIAHKSFSGNLDMYSGGWSGGGNNNNRFQH